MKKLFCIKCNEFTKHEQIKKLSKSSTSIRCLNCGTSDIFYNSGRKLGNIIYEFIEFLVNSSEMEDKK